MRKNTARFDLKFGKEFASQLPTGAAVYSIYDAAGVLIYVGKAKNLRRRLSQYRNAQRLKKQRKMLLIVAEAHRIEYELFPSHFEACLQEARLIQDLRPKWNTAGAFSFLYPMIGLKKSGEALSFCLTTSPDAFRDFSLHGAFRSRHLSGEGFFSLMRLLAFVGHRLKEGKAAVPKYSYLISFRKLPEKYLAAWEKFFSGTSREALEELILDLVENAGARRSPGKIQKDLNNLARFFRHEAKPLAKARQAVGVSAYPVPQEARDLLFLKYRFVLNPEPAAAEESGPQLHEL